MKRRDFTPDDLVAWCIAIGFGLVFVSCGVAALVGAFQP